MFLRKSELYHCVLLSLQLPLQIYRFLHTEKIQFTLKLSDYYLGEIDDMFQFEVLGTTYLQGVSVQKDKFKIMITVGLSYIRKHSW